MSVINPLPNAAPAANSSGLVLQHAKVVEPSCTFIPGMTFTGGAAMQGHMQQNGYW